MTLFDTIRDRANWVLQVSYVTVNLFFKTKMQNHAAAVAYYALLSLAPLMLLMVYMLHTYFSGFPEFREAFDNLVSAAHLDFLNQNLEQKVGAVSGLLNLTGGLGILLLLWSSKGLMKSIQSAFAVIFADSKKRGFIVSSLISLLAIPFFLLLIGMSVAADHLADHYASLDIPVFGDLLKSFLRLASSLATFLGIGFIVFLLYFKMPLARPGLASTLMNSLFCTLSLYGLESVLTHVVKIDKYVDLYGSLGDIIFVLLWVYMGSLIFFLWAQFLCVGAKIDVIALEKIFLESEDRSRLGLDQFLFSRSRRIFEKYGQHCGKGETIIRQNEDTATIYYLYSGQVGLYRENQGRLIRLGGLRGREIFGEMAYLLGERRTATVVAESDCFLFILSPETLESLMTYSAKLSRRIIESLCQRIAKMDRGVLASGFASDTQRHPVYNPDSGAV